MTRPASTNDIVVEDEDNEMLSIVLACAGVSVNQTLLYLLYEKVVSKIHQGREIIAIGALENGAFCTVLVKISINFSPSYSTVFFSITV
jgi:hypothetical protein